jgi:DNA-binding MarR family transcriptional regulator
MQATRAPHEATMLLREIRDLSAAFEAHLGQALTVNPTDLTAMEHLIQDGPLTPTDLAARVGVTTAAMTTSIDRLAALGHATRVPNPADRRGVLVVPTPESTQRAMASILPMVSGIDRVLDSFDEEQRAVVVLYLRQVIEAYKQHLPLERQRS